MQAKRAFTLFEMLITLTIILTLAAFVLPMWRSYVVRADDKVLQSQVLDAIQFAGQEARAMQQSIALCKSNASNRCTDDAVDRLIIFVDQYADGTIRERAQLLLSVRIKLNQGKLHSRFYPTHSAYLKFFPIDTTYNYHGAFWYCEHEEVRPRSAIMLGLMGHPHVVYPDKKGEIKDIQGKIISCH